MNGFAFLLGVVAVVLKLVGVEPVADWSWWIVTIPFWVGIALTVVALVLGLLAASVAAGVAAGSQAVYNKAKPSGLRPVGK